MRCARSCRWAGFSHLDGRMSWQDSLGRSRAHPRKDFDRRSGELRDEPESPRRSAAHQGATIASRGETRSARTAWADEPFRRPRAGARRGTRGDRRCARRPRPTRAVHGRSRHRQDAARRRIRAPRHDGGDARAVGTMLGRRRRPRPLAVDPGHSRAGRRPGRSVCALAQPPGGDRPHPAGAVVGGPRSPRRALTPSRRAFGCSTPSPRCSRKRRASSRS